MTSARAAIEALLDAREAGRTICPSEAARRLAGEGGEWRGRMGEVHEAAARLAREGSVRLTWRGAPVEPGAGPYRIART